MQELLGRISALDPQASLSLRVIACYDELIVGNVNTRALLAAAASLAGCTAGFRRDHPPRSMRVTPRGEVEPEAVAVPSVTSRRSDDLTVWLEREGEPHANDAMILERLAMAVRIRHGRGRRDSDHRRELGLVLDSGVDLEARRTAASRLNLTQGVRYRVVAAPLFAVWAEHPVGAEDVVATEHGPIHALVVGQEHVTVDASPSGVGLPASIDHLHRSFRAAVVALRLCSPPQTPSVRADDYGGLIELLADLHTDTDLPDVDALDKLREHTWAQGTLDALVRSGSVRQASRLASVHHSTLQSRLDVITDTIGFDPLDGLGRSRLGIAYLAWRLRNSRVLDLPAPVHPNGSAGVG